jgi:hypothetical protein
MFMYATVECVTPSKISQNRRKMFSVQFMPWIYNELSLEDQPVRERLLFSRYELLPEEAGR